MRFKRLKLAAFLSFKEKTEIDFAQFGNQLILLFGGSGVGKTAVLPLHFMVEAAARTAAPVRWRTITAILPRNRMSEATLCIMRPW